MIRLCFRHQDSGRVIAEVRADDPSGIPASDDCVYVPSAEAAGVYAYHRVVGREFYYDQEGGLALVNLECVEVPSSPVDPPQAPADPPTA